MRAIALLLGLILSGCTLAPAVTLAADERGWQGWAFEVRGGDKIAWFGNWTSEACEEVRRAAIAEELDAGIGACLPVTLADEPVGIAVWLVITREYAFVAALTPDICEDDPTPDLVIRRVALDYPFCRRVWLRVAV